MKKDNLKGALEDADDEYIGNIWGWKFSFISLGIIVAMLLLMLYRYSVVIKHPPGSDKQTITIDEDSSSLKIETMD